jgi:hypothetical protein
MTGQDIFQQAIDKYGVQAQANKAIEELSELIRAISRIENEISLDNFANLVEEMADVYIMLKQLEMIYCIEEATLEAVIEHKIILLNQKLK